MAADRSRLAAALAYKQAEEERRRRMLESIPTPAGTTPAQPAPQADFRTNLENLSIGVGEGLTNQLEGIKGLVTDPVGTAKGVYEAGKAVVRDPAIIASALRQMGQKAMSGPLGAGEVIGEMLGPRKTGPVMAELDVYHGTPHRFQATEANSLGEFDASKIGTGEGAQAYGHGIYLSESPEVGRQYQQFLAARKNDLSDPANLAASIMYRTPQGTREAGIGQIDRTFRAMKDYPRSYPDMEEQRATLQKARELLESGAELPQQGGSFYKADLPDEMIDRMLDWDKPLSEQPAAVREAIETRVRHSNSSRKFLSTNPTGEQLYDMFSDRGDHRNPIEAAATFKEAGIPGMIYREGQGKEKGLRNFVVFPGEERKVRILERDGQKAPPQKIAQALEAAPDYRMSHRPLKVEGGAAQLNKAYEVFGQDIYGPNALQYFGAGDPREAKTVAALKRLRDNPDAEVTIYRGVPADATGGIVKGDWVTLDKDVAQDYANLKPGQKGKVLTMKVKAKDVTTWPDSLLEFGYYPAE